MPEKPHNMVRLPKTYGKSREASCTFCGSCATTKNAQGLPVCRHHTKDEINLKCACGDYLDVKESKYGTFFLCFRCGPISWSKGLELNNLPLRSIDDV